jgi:hypothetical protein
MIMYELEEKWQGVIMTYIIKSLFRQSFGMAEENFSKDKEARAST